VVPQNGSDAVKTSARPLALVGVRIPSRHVNARQLVVRVYEENPHLQRADLWAVTRYAELSWKFRRLAERMEEMPGGGLMRADMEPRKLLSELRVLSETLLRHERDLGITAAARAGLGVDLGRLQSMDLASAMSDDGADVTALEGRIVSRLQQGGAADD
jgi:hypothetical protein